MRPQPEKTSKRTARGNTPIQSAWAISLALLAVALTASTARAAKKLVGSVASIPRFSVDSGGILASNANRSLNNAVGETGVSSFTGTGFRLHAGLMNIIAQPGSVASITAVTKSTGTLTLSWVAPGLDGPLGDVTGSYRIDASSDPLHIFDPTKFIVEFATSVSPGQAQSRVLEGLEPNTTYYTKIYLADSRKVAAEDSERSDESTLADVPDPAFSGVGSSSVTISWSLPAKGAEGYDADASSTAFGALFPGGVVKTSHTANGLVVSLTVQNLNPNTTYYFKLASLNWQSDLHYSVIIATRTLPGGPLAIEGLQVAGDGKARTVRLTWTNPTFLNPAGVTVLVSTNPITADPADGTPYGAGYAFADGSVVKSSAALATHLESGLDLSVTSYFKLYSKDVSNSYSVAVSTYVTLDMPPLMPAGLAAQPTQDGSSMTITWSAVTSLADGSSFMDASAPRPRELVNYEVYRATGIVRPTWELAASTPAWATSASVSIPESGKVYYYKVVSRSIFDLGGTDAAMVVDTLGNLYALGEDLITRIKIPASMASGLQPGGNPFSAPLFVRAQDRPADLGGRIVKSVSFEAFQSPTAKSAPLSLSGPGMDVVLRYETAGGVIVPSEAGRGGLLAGGPGAGARTAAAPQPAVRAADAAANLAAYLANGSNAIKLFGSVDSFLQTVRLESTLLGNYQIRTVLRDMGFNFDASGVSNRAITPNGDGLNDSAVFVFDNPKDSAFSGKIFDMKGSFVADMRPGPLARNSLAWDGKANGSVVPRGVYIYQIKAEDKSYSGTVVVVR